MTRFDRNDVSLIEKTIDQEVKHPKIGIVEQVFEHTAPDDDSNWEVDVLVDGQTTKLTRVPVHTPGSDIIAPPKNGDKILIIYRKGISQRPVALGTGWSNKDRPPLGLAGMYRNRFESGPSPAGDGDLHITGYTAYDGEVASTDKRELTPQSTSVQIAKHAEGDNIDPTEDKDLPINIEVYDSPADGESHVTIEGNQIDGDDTKGLDVELDFKTGIITVRGENGGDTYKLEIDVKNETAEISGDSAAGNLMGASFDFNGNGFKIADGNQFGIESDGSGNFVWSHNSIDMAEDGGSISL